MPGLLKPFDKFDVYFSVPKIQTSFCHQYIFLRIWSKKFSIKLVYIWRFFNINHNKFIYLKGPKMTSLNKDHEKMSYIFQLHPDNVKSHAYFDGIYSCYQGK